MLLHYSFDNMEKVYVCNTCGDEVELCENCNVQAKDFDPKSLICAEGLSDVHFCSQNCANEYHELTKSYLYVEEEDEYNEGETDTE